ncbi:sodium-dependent proline transporter-like [Babylonia areolata]|uniref:sodium-dependent proline transporter-like n=1 Tax=Babylonia areolata TaxID=304850 RepID=UPI003FD50A79
MVASSDSSDEQNGGPGGTGNGHLSHPRRDRRGIKGRRSQGGSEDEDVLVNTVSLHPGTYPPPRPHHNGSLPSSSNATLSRSSLFPPTRSTSLRSSGGALFSGDENVERGNWSGRFDFILSMLGYAVGLGNVWRFPYLCYRNGGGAFLLPFLLMMFVIGLPLFYMEASLGQFCSNGPMGCWQFAPLFKGLGLSMVAVSGLTAVYYNMILGWSLYYLFASFTSDLPWNTCDGHWNSKNCSLKFPFVTCEDENNVQNEDGSCTDVTSGDMVGLWNATLFTEETGTKLVSPSEEYWNGKALAISGGIDRLGQPKWDLSLCLLLAWVIVFFCLLKGIKTTGKVVYFTAIFPYVVLFILLIRGATLDNAVEGIRYFIVPDFARLADARVWKDAANQIFFSMSIAGGGLITLSSYNRFHNGILRDSLIVAIGDSLTCVLGGFVIFSFLGYMAGRLDVPVKEVVKDGAGLAFIVYPEAVSSLPPSTLWALLFFLMLITLGLDSQFAMVETVLTGVMDQYPHLRPRKTLVIFIICCIFFLLGLPLACPGGMYLLQLMDNYVGGLTLIIIGFFEIIAIVYVYGCHRFCQDIHIMTGSTNFIYWKVTWYALSPLTIGFIFVFMLVEYKGSTYGDYMYPWWADGLGWLMAIFCLIFIPLVMLYKVDRETEADTLLKKLRLLTTPTDLWGPSLPKHRQLVTYVEDFDVDPFSRRALETGTPPPQGFTNLAFTPDPAHTPTPPPGPLSRQSKRTPQWRRSQSTMSDFSSVSTTRTANSALTFESNV